MFQVLNINFLHQSLPEKTTLQRVNVQLFAPCSGNILRSVEHSKENAWQQET